MSAFIKTVEQKPSAKSDLQQLKTDFDCKGFPAQTHARLRQKFRTVLLNLTLVKFQRFVENFKMELLNWELQLICRMYRIY